MGRPKKIENEMIGVIAVTKFQKKKESYLRIENYWCGIIEMKNEGSVSSDLNTLAKALEDAGY